MKGILAIITLSLIFSLVACCGYNENGYDSSSSWCNDSSSSSNNSPPPTPLGPPLITSTNASNTVITFNLSGNNLTSLSTIQSKITIRKGGFTGSSVSFAVVQISPTQYNLQGFVLSSGTYYLTFESGTFQSSILVSQSGVISFGI
ncbi:MAG TPA: hypothetical protein ENI73_05580 [Spirochaetes bacterium]|nr:hypothetical protein [Spirochaetota bacterium]